MIFIILVKSKAVLLVFFVLIRIKARYKIRVDIKSLDLRGLQWYLKLLQRLT